MIYLLLICFPFLPNAERAYGRLKELGKGHLAVRCHGYLTLSASQKEDLETRLGPFVWGHEEDLEEYGLKDEPVRVIVKDFLEGTTQFKPIHARKMLRDMREFHRSGILVADVKSDIYIDGVVDDFSHAHTLPHLLYDPEFGIDQYDEGREAIWNDLVDLETVFDCWNNRKQNKPKIKIKAAAELRCLSRLRNKEPTYTLKMFDCLIPWSSTGGNTTSPSKIRHEHRVRRNPPGRSRRRLPHGRQNPQERSQPGRSRPGRSYPRHTKPHELNSPCAKRKINDKITPPREPCTPQGTPPSQLSQSSPRATHETAMALE